MHVRARPVRHSRMHTGAAVALALATLTAALLALLAAIAGPARADTLERTTVGNASFARAGVVVSDVDPDSTRCATFGFCGDGPIYRSTGGELIRVVGTDGRFSEIEGYFGGADLRRGFAYTAEVVRR
jgi:hypothetical protein